LTLLGCLEDLRSFLEFDTLLGVVVPCESGENVVEGRFFLRKRIYSLHINVSATRATALLRGRDVSDWIRLREPTEVDYGRANTSWGYADLFGLSWESVCGTRDWVEASGEISVKAEATVLAAT